MEAFLSSKQYLTLNRQKKRLQRRKLLKVFPRNEHWKQKDFIISYFYRIQTTMFFFKFLFFVFI